MSDSLVAPTAAPARHLVSPSDLDLPLVESLLALASDMERQGQSPAQAPLRGRIMASVFYEPSTRTRFSFEAAMLRLGVRETRRASGDYMLTGEDVIGAARFDDAVACGAWPQEFHVEGKATEWRWLERGERSRTRPDGVEQERELTARREA